MIIGTSIGTTKARIFGSSGELDDIALSNDSEKEKYEKVISYWRKNGLHKFDPKLTFESDNSMILCSKKENRASKIPITQKGQQDLGQDTIYQNSLIKSGASQHSPLVDYDKLVDTDSKFVVMEYFPSTDRQLLDNAERAEFARAVVYKLIGFMNPHDFGESKSICKIIKSLPPKNHNLLSPSFDSNESEISEFRIHPSVRKSNVAQLSAVEIYKYCRQRVFGIPHRFSNEPEVMAAKSVLRNMAENFGKRYGLRFTEELDIEPRFSCEPPREYLTIIPTDFSLENILCKDLRAVISDQKNLGSEQQIAYGMADFVGTLVNNLDNAASSIGSSRFNKNARKLSRVLTSAFYDRPAKVRIFPPRYGKEVPLTRIGGIIKSEDDIREDFLAGSIVGEVRYIARKYGLGTQIP